MTPTLQTAAAKTCARSGTRLLSSSAQTHSHGIERVGVVGSGQMGLGIAYVSAKVSYGIEKQLRKQSGDKADTIVLLRRTRKWTLSSSTRMRPL